MQRRLQGSSSCLFHAPALPSFVSLSSSLSFPSPSAPGSAPIPYPIVSIARLLGPALALLLFSRFFWRGGSCWRLSPDPSPGLSFCPCQSSPI
ncbi:hypothetical protein BDV11DRAFT_193970 [Aspergillus similis]